MKALVIIDMQMEMQHRIDAGRDCVNSDAPDRIAMLSEAFRKRGQPVIHIRHSADDRLRRSMPTPRAINPCHVPKRLRASRSS